MFSRNSHFLFSSELAAKRDKIGWEMNVLTQRSHRKFEYKMCEKYNEGIFLHCNNVFLGGVVETTILGHYLT